MRDNLCGLNWITWILQEREIFPAVVKRICDFTVQDTQETGETVWLVTIIELDPGLESQVNWFQTRVLLPRL